VTAVEANLDELPAGMRDLVALIGLRPALKLVDAFGGITLPIPKGDAARGVVRRESLIEVIGVRATELLIDTYGGDRLYVPSCRAAMLQLRDREICAQYGAGVGVAELAIKYRLSDRHIWSILKKTDVSSPQASLF